jgi:hypothetical protein
VKRRLADIADIRTGFPFRTAVKPDANGTLAVVQMKDIDELAGLDSQSCVRLMDDPKRFEQHLLRLGDVLLQSRGERFPAALVDKPIHGIAALGLMVIRPRNVEPEFLTWLLNQPWTREDMRSMSRGTYVPFLTRENLAALTISIPSVDAQHKLVALDRLRRRERQLSARLTLLNDQLIDAIVREAAASNSRN